MGNFVRSTAMDYGSLRVITDYGELRVVFLIFQHRSYFFHVGGQNFMFFELSAEQQHLLMHKLPLVDLEPFRQQARKGWWNLEINARPEVMTNISHVCLRPHVIKRHTGERHVLEVLASHASPWSSGRRSPRASARTLVGSTWAKAEGDSTCRWETTKFRFWDRFSWIQREQNSISWSH